MLDLSIVIPVKDEQDSVGPLAAEIAAALAPTPWTWECLWVDDASSDRSAALLADLVRADPRHRLLRLAAPTGQSGALLAGFARTRGRWTATLDADLQNDPADLPRLLRMLEAGEADMINGRRAQRRDGWVRRVSSRVANGARNALTGRTVSDVGCSLRVMRRECVAGLPPFRGLHRFLPTLAAQRGFRLAETDVGHRPRVHGRTKYGVGNRLWVGIDDLFGVMWLRRRGVWPRLLDEGTDAEDGA